MDYITICIITQAFALAYGQAYNEMDELIGHLFNESRYNKFLRPLQNQSQVMKVNFTQYLTNIEYFDISSGELLISGFFEIAWKDELLTWNPSMYGGKEMIPLPKGKFWTPEFTLTNEGASDESLEDSRGFSPAWVTYHGYVVMVPAGTYKIRCDVDTTLYPFDIHTCSFNFLVSNHDITELMVYSPTGNLDTSNLIDNGEWLVENTNAIIRPVSDRNIDRLSLPLSEASFSLKRRPAFEIINKYTPIMLMTVLNLFICFVKPDTGERLTFAITLYLSYVFTTTSLVETIPSNSLKIPHMSYIVLIINILNTVGVLWSIFIVNLSRKADIGQRLPAFIKNIVMKNKKADYKSNKIKPDDRSATSVVSLEREETTNETNIVRTPENKAANDCTGQEVAEILDRAYFLIASIVFFVFHLVYAIFFVVGWDKT